MSGTELPISGSITNVLLWLAAVALALGAGVLIYLYRRYYRHLTQGDSLLPPTCDQTAPSAILPLFSVVIPARNEEANIEACVKSVLAQDYPSLEVIAVDDDSTDGTGERLAGLAGEDNRLTVFQGSPLPRGWTGKCFALSQGASVARGDWLAFIDADVTIEPRCLSSALEYARSQNLGMLSLIPGQRLVGFWEKLVQPAVLSMVALRFLPLLGKRLHGGGPRRPSEEPAAVGQFLLFSRAAYEKIGGHHSVAHCICEDIALAQVMERSGSTWEMLRGQDLLSVRMYHSFGELCEGWTKGIYEALGRNLLRTASLTLAFALAFIWPPASLLLLGLIWLRSSNAEHLLALLAGSVLINLLCTFYRLNAYRLMRWDRRYEPLFPLGMLLTIGMLLVSAMKHKTGMGVRWKDRSYPTTAFPTD